MDIEKALDDADVLISQFSYDKAIATYNSILKHHHDSADALLMRGALLGQLGQVDNAITDIERAIIFDPKNDSSYITLAYLHQQKGNLARAFDLCKSSLDINNNNPDAIKLIIKLGSQLGQSTLLSCEFNKSELYFKTVLRYQPNDARILFKLVLVYRSLGQIEKSIEYSELTTKADPNHIRAKIHTASSYELIGEITKGQKLIEEILIAHPDHALANIVYAQYSLRSKQQEKGITALLKILNNDNLLKEDSNSALMLLGTLYNSINKFDLAFKYFKQANDMLNNNYDPLSYKNYISSSINYFSKEKYASIPFSSNDSNELIFIVGIPRSGTSLIEQIISSHSNVFGAGELPHVNNTVISVQENEKLLNPFPLCLDEVNQETINRVSNKLAAQIRNNNDSLRITDKMPHDFHHIGFLHKLFPKAKFINCERDARDTCLSCYFQSFAGYHPYAYNLNALGVHYLEYKRLMNHWTQELNIPVLTLSYEKLVSDTQNEVENLLKFLDLPWEDQCMQFHKQDRITATASYNQVNKKIYSDSVGRWKNYEDYITDLTDALNE